MAKDVKFTINLKVDGKEHIIEAATNSKKLASELGLVHDRASSVGEALKGAFRLGVVFQTTISSLQQLTGVMNQYATAYNTQAEAEMKLSTVMKQRMGASEKDIQAMKDLASAQQKLGVVGDEVQLMGMQQLATFASQRQTLETLIPAMNNLLVQQNGLKSTGSDAVGVANLLGKALMGNASALTRVGITMSEAEKQSLKYANETERAAIIARIITNNVGDMNAEMAKTDAGKAQQLSNAIGDMKEKIGDMNASWQPAIQAVSEFGITVFSLTSAATGIFGIIRAVKSLHLVTLAVAAAQKLWNWHLASYRAFAVAAAAGTRGLQLAMVGLGAALRTVLVATGVGAAIMAVGYAVEYLTGRSDKASSSLGNLSEEEQKAKAAHEAEAQEVNRVTAQMQQHIAMLANFKGTKAEEKKLVQELNDTYGATMGYFSSVSAWYKALTANSETYCRQMVIEARTRRLANQIAEVDAQIHDINYDEEGNRRQYSTTDNDKNWVVDGGGTTSWGGIQTYGHYETVPGTSSWDKAAQKTISLTKQRTALQNQLNESVKEGAALDYKIKGAPTAPTGATTTAHTPPRTGGGGNTNTEADTGPKLTENATTYRQLADNVAYYQKQMESANFTDEEAFSALVAKKNAADDALEAYNKMVDGMRVKESDIAEGSVADIEKNLQRIDDRLSKENLDLEARVELQTERNDIQKQLDDLSREVTFKAAIEGRESSLKEIDAAIQFYTERQQGEDADQIRKTQDEIDRLTGRRKVLELSVELAGMSREVGEIQELTEKEQKIRVSAIGIDELTKRIKELNRLMSDTKHPVTAAQRQEMERLVGVYEDWRKESAKSFDTLREGWSGVKGIGGGIESLSESLKGNGNAWKRVTSLVDGFLQIYDGISNIIKIIEMMTEVSEMHTAAKIAEGTAVGAEAAVEGTASGEAVTASTANTVAAHVETAAFTELAAAKYLAAHAYIPFAGFGIGAGFATAAKTLVASMGAIGTFAEGGIAFGPTLGIFGEYAGAATNPEIVAPLDKLRSLLEPQHGTSKVKFEIRGRKLIGVQEKEKRHQYRM